MDAIVALLVTVVLFLVAVMLQGATNLPMILLCVLATASWAAWDSTRIRVRECKSGIALHPVSLWFGVALLWIVGFPWYLVVRHKVKGGTQERKAPEAATNPTP
jgi:hypothetical protein